MRLPLLIAALLGSLAVAGCPSRTASPEGTAPPPEPQIDPRGGPQAGPAPSADDDARPEANDPAPASDPPPAAAGAPGDAMAGPPGPPSIPDPDDGRAQTHLLREHPLRVGGRPLTVWIADTEPSRRLGLMHVREMPETHGMLFVYPRTARRSFWMKNTYVPLSLAYITSDGRIDQLWDMEPLQTRRVYPSRAAVRYVLEVNQGWFERHGVEVGDRVEGLEALVGR